MSYIIIDIINKNKIKLKSSKNWIQILENFFKNLNKKIIIQKNIMISY